MCTVYTVQYTCTYSHKYRSLEKTYSNAMSYLSCGLVSWHLSLHLNRGLRFLEAVEEELSRTMATIVEVVKVMIGTGRPWKMLEDEGW